MSPRINCIQYTKQLPVVHRTRLPFGEREITMLLIVPGTALSSPVNPIAGHVHFTRGPHHVRSGKGEDYEH